MSVFSDRSHVWHSYLHFSLPERLEQRRAGKNVEASLFGRFRVWLEPKRLLISIGVLVALIVVFLVLLVTGNVGAFYDWLIGWSSESKPWTHIMRDDPWISWVFAPLALTILFFLVPRYAFGRLWIISAAFLAGFLGPRGQRVTME